MRSLAAQHTENLIQCKIRATRRGKKKKRSSMQDCGARMSTRYKSGRKENGSGKLKSAVTSEDRYRGVTAGAHQRCAN